MAPVARSTIARLRALMAPLPTFTAISSAAANKASLLICAAPLIQSSISSLRWDDPIGEKISHLIQRQVSLYALPNSFAAAPGGFDDSLAERLGLAASGTLVPTVAENELKFVVFVPENDLNRVQQAASEAGAGVIGLYSHCSFQTTGIGKFIPRNGANPSKGRVGNMEEVKEVRLEMRVSERDVKGLIAAVLEAHPYEEVVYDIYPLRNPGVFYGRGRIGELPLNVSLDTVLAQVNDALELGVEFRARCSHRTGVPIHSLAVASGTGAGESLLWAAHRQNAGAFITGAVSVYDLILADGLGTVLIDVGFSASVAAGLQRLVTQLRDTFEADGIRVVYSP